jgi:hypothetical protein
MWSICKNSRRGCSDNCYLIDNILKALHVFETVLVRLIQLVSAVDLERKVLCKILGNLL